MPDSSLEDHGKMKAFCYSAFGSTPFAWKTSVAVPQVWRGGVLIKVAGSSTNHFDYFITRIPPARWVMSGWPGGFDVSGTVVACAADVKTFSVGDRVFGFGQGFAEYATTRSWLLAKIPDNVDDVSKMGMYPSVAVTALQMLNQCWLDRPNADRVKKVMIVGASGGVGSSLLQLIRAKCDKPLSIIAVSSSKNEEYCRSLGATDFIDYGKLPNGRLSGSVAGGSVDLVFDTVSGNFGTANYVSDGMSLLTPSTGLYVSTNSIQPMDYLSKLSRWITGRKNTSQFELFMVNLFRAQKDLNEIAQYVKEKKFDLQASETVVLTEENMRTALAKMETRHQTGKIHSQPVPSSMKAMVYDKAAHNRMLFQSDHPVPSPNKNEVLVKVAAASMNPIDFRIADRKKTFRKYPSWVMGCDFAGTIVATGRFVRGFAVGDAVFGFGAGYASFALAKVNEIARIPQGEKIEDFGVYGLVGTCAHQILRKHWLDKPNFNVRSLLVIGATGGVGSSLIQMARAYGGPELKIFAIASVKNCEFARTIGANECADYSQRDFDIARAFPVHSMDLIVDLVSGSPESTDYLHEDSKLLLKPRGKYVVVNSMSALDRFRANMTFACACDMQKSNFDLFFTMRSQADIDLQAVARLVQERKYTLEVAEEVPLLETPVRNALQDLRLRHVRGKIRIRPTEFGSEEHIPFQSPKAQRASGS